MKWVLQKKDKIKINCTITRKEVLKKELKRDQFLGPAKRQQTLEGILEVASRKKSGGVCRSQPRCLYFRIKLNYQFKTSKKQFEF